MKRDRHIFDPNFIQTKVKRITTINPTQTVIRTCQDGVNNLANKS